MNIGISIRIDSGGGAARATVADIIGAADIVAGWDARDLSTSPVASWPDASGNGLALTSTGSARPTWSASGGPNGQPAVLFDGIDDYLHSATLDLPAPGTTPTTFWFVMRQRSWTEGRRFWDCGAAGFMTVVQQSVPNSIFAFNGSGGPLIAMPLDTFVVVEVTFTNSTSDTLRVDSVAASGFSCGNQDPAANFVMGAANQFSALPSNIQVCEGWIFRKVLTDSERERLRAYAFARYGIPT